MMEIEIFSQESNIQIRNTNFTPVHNGHIEIGILEILSIYGPHC